MKKIITNSLLILTLAFNFQAKADPLGIATIYLSTIGTGFVLAVAGIGIGVKWSKGELNEKQEYAIEQATNSAILFIAEGVVTEDFKIAASLLIDKKMQETGMSLSELEKQGTTPMTLANEIIELSTQK